MQLDICDICGVPIKHDDKKYAMAVQEIIEDNTKYNDAWAYMQAMQQKYQKLQVKEICEKCKRVYDHLFSLRKEEIEKLNEEINKSYDLKLLKNKEKEEDYCTCIVPDPDWKNHKVNESFLRCKICGKVIDPYAPPPENYY